MHMSNWFDDDKKQEQQPLITPPPAGFAPDETAAPADVSSPEEPAAPAEPTPQEPAGETPAAGWQRGDSAAYTGAPVTPPAQPAAPTYSWGASYTPPAQSEPNNGPIPPAGHSAPGYQPQSGYNPYGWNAAQTPPPGKPPKKKRNKSNIVIAALAVICGATIITLSVLLALSMDKKGGLPTTSGGGGGTTSTTENPNAPTLNFSDADVKDGGLTSKEIIDKNLNSTVVISMYENVTSGGFYGGTTSEQQAGGATGIIMTSDGYIITNWHCVINEKTNRQFARIQVTTYDGTKYDQATVIGADKDTDLAVIKINAANLKAAEFGDSSQLSMGDRVVALGNAGGLEWSASQGIVSGTARDVYDDTGYSIKCLQTDAAINPGNSGGPLLNNQGQVIGVNSAKIVAEGYEGLGFSIPIKEAKVIIDDLLKYGYVKGRVMLGIMGNEVATPGYEGFMINSINEGSVLQGTKAQAGDIITHVNKVRVTTYTAMRTELTKYNVGDTITLTLLRVDSRTGKTVSFDVQCVLGESTGK